jgi:hypothetical protein
VPTLPPELEDALGGTAAAVRSLTDAYHAGDLPLDAWADGMASQVKLAHSAAAVAALGDDAEPGNVQAAVEPHLTYLHGFLADLSGDDPPGAAQSAARAELYARSAAATYWNSSRDAARLSGLTQERRVLGPAAQHCDACVSHAALGWQPLGTLPPIGHNTPCKVGCTCSFEFRTTPPGEDADFAQRRVPKGSPGGGRFISSEESALADAHDADARYHDAVAAHRRIFEGHLNETRGSKSYGTLHAVASDHWKDHVGPHADARQAARSAYREATGHRFIPAAPAGGLPPQELARRGANERYRIRHMARVASFSWDESKRHRGQPGNAGQFGPGGSGHPLLEGALSSPRTLPQLTRFTGLPKGELLDHLRALTRAGRLEHGVNARGTPTYRITAPAPAAPPAPASPSGLPRKPSGAVDAVHLIAHERYSYSQAIPVAEVAHALGVPEGDALRQLHAARGEGVSVSPGRDGRPTAFIDKGPGGLSRLRPEPTTATPTQKAAVKSGLESALAGTPAGKLVPVHELRAKVPAPDRAAFDDAARTLWREGKVRLVSLADLHKATVAQLDASIPGTNETFFYLEPTASAHFSAGPGRNLAADLAGRVARMLCAADFAGTRAAGSHGREIAGHLRGMYERSKVSFSRNAGPDLSGLAPELLGLPRQEVLEVLAEAAGRSWEEDAAAFAREDQPRVPAGQPGGGEFGTGGGKPKRYRLRDLPGVTPLHLADQIADLADSHYRNMRTLLKKMLDGEYAPEDVVADVDHYRDGALRANHARHGKFEASLGNKLEEGYGAAAMDSPHWEAVLAAAKSSEAEAGIHVEDMADAVRHVAAYYAAHPDEPVHIRKGTDDANRVGEIHDDMVAAAHAEFHKIFDAVDAFKAAHDPLAGFAAFTWGDAAFSFHDQPRVPAGRPGGGGWGGGGRPGTAAARTAASDAVRAFASGQGPHTAAEAQALAGHLARLTVAQIHTLKAEHGLKGSAANKAALVAKLAERFRAARASEYGLPESPRPGKVYNAVPSELHVDPSRFQYKLGTDTSGVTAELKSVRAWNPDFAGVVSVWKDPADGKTYVVNGHHRHELATRLGAPALAVRYVNARTATEARAVGALVNIAEGRGTAVDAAKFMRDSGVGIGDMERHGVSVRGKVAEDAVALARLSDRAFGKLTLGTLDQSKALAVAKHLPDHALQDQLFGLLDKREDEGKDLSLRTIEEMAREMAATPTHTRKEASLFGDIESEESLFVPRNELKGHVRAELSKEVNDFLAVASERRAGRVAGAGNVLDVEKNRQIAEQAARVRNVFDTLVNRRGEISDAINDAAGKLAAARTKRDRDAARSEAVNSVRDAVLREAGLGRPETPEPSGAGKGTAGGGGGGAPERGTGAAQASADAGRGSPGAAGLSPHVQAQAQAALERYANRDATAKGGGLFGGEDMQARQGFARLPDGAPVVFTEGEFAGRTGKIVRDTSGGADRIAAEVDGRPGLVPVDYTTIEPLNAALSWRTEAAGPPVEQRSLLSAEHFLPRRKE